jgi:hypothetical protein
MQWIYMLKLTFHHTTKPVPEDPLPIAELSLSIDPPIPRKGPCKGYPFLRVVVTTWSAVGDATTSELSFPLLGPDWPEVTATLTKKGRQAPNLHIQLPTGHTVTLPAELKPGLQISGLPDLSPPPSECAGN